MEQGTLLHVKVLGIDHDEFLVNDACATAKYLREVWGFEEFAYADRSTGREVTESRVLRQGSIIIILSQAIDDDSPVFNLIQKYGECVHDIALLVDDVRREYETALKLGAKSAAPIREFRDENDPEKIIMRHAAIRTSGHLVHTLIERDNYPGIFAPGFVPVDYPLCCVPPVGLIEIDHEVINEERGHMDPCASFYKKIFGFHEIARFTERQISTDKAALRSVVVRSENGAVTIPINEPVKGKFGHIDEFLRDRRGPGIQHMAFRTDDIVETVGILRARGVTFIDVPDTYYDLTPVRLKRAGLKIEIPQLLMDDLKRLRILIDGDEKGYLLQTFTTVILGSGAGLFFEIIERCGNDGFGVGNFLALFEAIERAAGRLK